MLNVGFARIDITPPLGVSLKGYYRTRICDGVLDPLEINAVAFDDGSKRAIVMSIDILGIKQDICAELREKISAAASCDAEAVYLHCTHTHLAPPVGQTPGIAGCVTQEDYEYTPWFTKRIVDVAIMALDDLAPATGYYTCTEARDISFIRRFQMKNGTYLTNPGWQNPDIDHPVGTPDETATLLFFKRESKPEIAIAHFQTHPDVISGTKVSADWPGFVRRTYERLVENSKCVCLVGAEGDTNHIDVRLTKAVGAGYQRSRYMGEKIAFSLIANRPLARKMEKEAVRFGTKYIRVRHNKGRPDEIEEAIRISSIYRKTGDRILATEGLGVTGMAITTAVAKACRIADLMDLDDERDLLLSAVAVGDAVFAGIPGEPFTDIGRAIKDASPYAVTLPGCNTNGKEGYYSTDHLEGSYETANSRYQADTPKIIIEGMTELIRSL